MEKAFENLRADEMYAASFKKNFSRERQKSFQKDANMHFGDTERFFRFFERFPSSQLGLEKLDPQDASEMTGKYNFLRNLVFRDVVNKTYQSGLSLERKYGFDSDFNLMVKEGDMSIKPWIDDTLREVDGVSLADLLTEKKNLSRANPVGVLGYFLDSLNVKDMSQVDSAVDPLSLERAMDFTKEELKKTQREFPEVAGYVTVAHDLHETLLEAFRRSTNILLDPKHPSFTDLKELTGKFLVQGSPSQREKLSWILLQTFNQRGSRMIYRDLAERIKDGCEVDFYSTLTDAIKDEYEGLTLGDLRLDNSDSLDAPEPYEVCRRLVGLKKSLLQRYSSLRTSFSSGTDLADGLPFPVENINIEIQSGNGQQYVEIEYVLAPDAEENSIILWIYREDVDWSILEDPSENFGFFTSLTEHAFSVLSSLSHRSKPGAGARDKSKSEKEHFRDPIYDLRRQSRMRAGIQQEEKNLETKEVNNSQNRKPILFREEFLQDLPEREALQVKKAIEKYDSGLVSVKKLVEYRGKVVDSMWILRQGKMRVILENTPDGLIPVEAGLREDIYRKIQAAGRQRG